MRARAATSRPASSLYAIADADCLGSDPGGFAERVAAIVRGGVRLLQLRLKPTGTVPALGDGWRFEVIERTLERLPQTLGGVSLWLDDRVDLAACFPSAFQGVHLGQRDLSPAGARRVLAATPGPDGRRGLIGLSCHDLTQIRAAEQDSAVDWVALGPVFATTSKVDPDPVVGLGAFRSARAATRKPLVAIGGIGESRIAPVLAAGADAVVVLSALAALGTDPAALELTARRLVAAADGGTKAYNPPADPNQEQKETA